MIENFIGTLRLMYVCWKSVREARRDKRIVYFTIFNRHHVPVYACLLATDRQAWELATVAVSVLRRHDDA